MALKIAALSDVHFDDAPCTSKRRNDISDILLLRAVHKINRFIKPDITVILGDLINNPEAVNAQQQLQKLREVTDLIESPTIILPGNHDGDPDRFYSVFDRPADYIDIKGVRFVPFLDAEEPGYNARRQADDLERMARVAHDFNGPLIALHHVPLFTPGKHECPYNYTNADVIIAAMRKYGFKFAMAGHYHEGVTPMKSDDNKITFLATPALCESPFTFWEINIDGGSNDARVTPHSLKIPEELELVDYHVHTPYAYCNENMDIEKSLDLAKDFGLAGLVFTEHSSHLYCTRQEIYAGNHFKIGSNVTRTSNCRMDSYFADVEKICSSRKIVGLEIDSDFDGGAMVLPEDLAKINTILGSVHALRTICNGETDMNKIADDFLSVHEKFLKCGLEILAHPLRIFNLYQRPIPSKLFDPLIRMLRENNVAAEINFHTNNPHPDFFRRCLDEGVKISFGSDSHNLYEIGNFSAHLDFLKFIGFNGDLSDILYRGDR